MSENKSLNKINKVDVMFILIITIFTSSLVYLLINANNQLGIYCSDVFIYLTNSLNFAGYPIGKTSNLYLSPVICIITSLIFKLGYTNQIAIFTVTGSFLPIASIGIYFLFKLRLNRIISLFGAILFSSFSLNILWTANGTMDIPAIAISIWIIYFTILAVNKNPKYYLLAFPLFVIGFFTRYTVGFILPLMLLYILFEIDIIGKLSDLKSKKSKKSSISYIKTFIKELLKSEQFKYFLLGILIALAIFSLFLIFLSSIGTELTFISQAQNVVSGDKGSSLDPGFKPDPYFYLENLGNFISSNSVEFHDLIPVLKNPGIMSYFVLVLISGGGLLYILELVFRNIKKNRIKNNKDKNNYNNDKNDYNKDKNDYNKDKNNYNKNNHENKIKKDFNKTFYLKVLLIIIIACVIIITYKQISSVISEILFLINILLIYNILNYIINPNNLIHPHNSVKSLNFNLLMISWFFIYLIFFSFSDVKVDRYFITILPVIAYFGAYCLNFLSLRFIEFLENYKNKKKLEKSSKNETISTNKYLIQKIIVIILILIFMVSAFSSVGIIPSKNKDIEGSVIISEWLKNYDLNYQEKIIWVHNTRYYTWYLMMNVGGLSEKDISKLGKNNVIYYISKNISKENYTIENYTIIKKYNDIIVYERIWGLKNN